MSQQVRKIADFSLGLFLIIGMSVLTSTFFLTSCAVDKEATATNSAGGDSGTNTVGNTIDNGKTGQNITVNAFEVSFDENSEFDIYWSLDEDRNGVVSSSEWGQPCKIDKDETSSKWVQCIMDVDELDMWMRDITINVELPGETCAYLGFLGYHYAISKVGEMPTAVSYYLDETAGTVSNVLYYYGEAGTDYNAITGVGGISYTSALNIEKKEDIICPWDYSKRHKSVDGKNCCDGTYTPYVTNTIGVAPIPQDDAEWGGNISNCFKGPAMEDSIPKISKGIFKGLPRYYITEVVGDGYGEEYTIKGGHDNPIGDHLGGYSIYWANYFKMSDHSNARPKPTNQASVGFPYYRFDCLDHNLEVVHRIDVLIREWNTKDQIALGASGNPDITGIEDPPFSGDPYDADEVLNDHYDWKDLASYVNTCFPSGTTIAPTTCSNPLDYY